MTELPLSPAVVGIVVPAHDEQELLPACLRSLAIAAAAVEVPVRVVVVLDRCRDRTAEVIEEFRAAGLPVGLQVRAVDSAGPGVGAARASGVRAILVDRAHSAEQIWLATTDADSEVPADWLVRQLRHAADGAEMVVGTVRVLDWSQHPVEVRQHYLAEYGIDSAGRGHGHMHGANLGFTAARYLAVGGFAEVVTDEDTDLISRFEAAGAALVWAADVAVVTSARPVGRAPAGFASYLADIAELTEIAELTDLAELDETEGTTDAAV